MAKFIQSDYDTAVKCSTSIKEQVKEIERCREKEKALISASKNYWKGNSGDEMREGFGESRKRLKTIITEMEGLAADIVTVAGKLKNKDEELAKEVSILDKILDLFD